MDEHESNEHNITSMDALRTQDPAVPTCKLEDHQLLNLWREGQREQQDDQDQQVLVAAQAGKASIKTPSCRHSVPDLSQVALAFNLVLRACPSSSSSGSKSSGAHNTTTSTCASRYRDQKPTATTKKSDRERDSHTILNAYVVGSHLWGTCHSGSDWDLIIVVSDGPKLTNYKMNAHKGSLEACIVSADLYLSSLREHLMQFLATLWIPKRFVVVETFDPRPNFHLHGPTLLQALEELRERDVRVAKKHFVKSDLKRARRTVVHCVMFLKLGRQLVSSGKITDYQCGEEERACVMEMPASSTSSASSWEEVIAPVEAAMKLMLETHRVAS